MTQPFRPAGLETREIEIAGLTVRLSSYEVGRRFSCRVDNIDPGGNIARATGATREEAEKAAIESATLAIDLRSMRSRLAESTGALRTRETSMAPLVGRRPGAVRDHTKSTQPRGAGVVSGEE